MRENETDSIKQKEENKEINWFGVNLNLPGARNKHPLSQDTYPSAQTTKFISSLCIQANTSY